MLTDEEYKNRIEAARKDSDWVEIYVDLFKKTPDVIQNDWGFYPIEKIVAAVIDKKPLKPKKIDIPRSAVL